MVLKKNSNPGNKFTYVGLHSALYQIRNFLNEACEDDDFDSEPYSDILKRIKKEGNQLLKRGRKVLKALRLSVV